MKLIPKVQDAIDHMDPCHERDVLEEVLGHLKKVYTQEHSDDLYWLIEHYEKIPTDTAEERVARMNALMSEIDDQL